MVSINFSIRIAVCDDEPKDMKVLRGLLDLYLDSHHYHVKVDEFSSGEEFLSTGVSGYHLAILDIFMGDLNGIETARKILEQNPEIQIIFCSSSNAYAAESYDVSALRYLTKPVEGQKFFRTMDRFFHRHTSLRTLSYMRSRMEEHIYLSEVLWIEANGHNCILHTRGGDVSTTTSMAQFTEQLENADFVKPIRYALVSLKAVAAIPTDTMTLQDGSSIPISRTKREEIKKIFLNYKMSAMNSGGAW